MGLRTINLKLHKPSKSKQFAINDAIKNYNDAFNFLLKKAHEDIDNIEQNYRTAKGVYSSLAISKWVDKDISSELNYYNVQPFKDSLKLDLGMTLASYFAQKKNNEMATFPHYYQNTDKQRPIYFCRYDTKRSYSLLYDSRTESFFAKLYLMNSLNAKASPKQKYDRELIYISSKNEIFERKASKETFIVVPLSFGKWQENMLKMAVNNPQILRTSKLLSSGGEYYLSLSIDLPEDEVIEVESYLGLCRGLENNLNYTVADLDGNLIEYGIVEDHLFEQDKSLANKIHLTANKVVELALRFKSMVILQNLVEKGDKLSWNDDGKVLKPAYGCRKYNELVRVLDYKLPQKGLPIPAKVSSVDIFYRCSRCGSYTRKNRFSKSMFICTTCGLSNNIEKLGSFNLATKLIKYANMPIKIKAKRQAEGVHFQNMLIGIDVVVPYNENPYIAIQDEIEKILDSLNENKAKKNMPASINNVITKLKDKESLNLEFV